MHSDGFETMVSQKKTGMEEIRANLGRKSGKGDE